MATHLSPAQQRVNECERTFRRFGLPMLVDDHSNKRDVFGRAAPVLLVLCIVGIVGAVNLDWSWWQNTLAIIGATGLIIAAFCGFNVLRGRRWSQLPQSVGTAELAFLVVAPALPPVIAGGQWGTALLTIVGNLIGLGVIWVVVRYGIASSLWWGLRGGLRDLADSLLRLIRFLPLLLIFSIALFYNNEVWTVFDHTTGVSDAIVAALFAVLIVGILQLQLRSETAQVLATAERLQPPPEPESADPPAYTPQQLSNVRVMVAMYQLLQVVVVSTGVGVFFAILGTLTITQGVMTAWNVDGGWVQQVQVLGTDLVVSQTLLRVCTAMATFTGLYYAISVLTDSLYRDDFIDGMGAKLCEVHVHRRRYTWALAQLRAESARGEQP